MSPGGRPLAHGVVGFGQQLQRAMSQADAAFNVTGEAADGRADDGYPAEDSPGSSIVGSSSRHRSASFRLASASSGRLENTYPRARIVLSTGRSRTSLAGS